MRKKRVQEGIIHVYVRGNGRFRVFYDDEDCIIFLKKCDRFARKHNTQILEFVLMINHVHLLVKTYTLTLFMKELLHSYSVWYNRKYKHSNKIFRTPFSSVEKRSEEWVLQNSVYILQNPVKAGLCRDAEAYQWSSLLFHFPDKAVHMEEKSEKNSCLISCEHTGVYNKANNCESGNIKMRKKSGHRMASFIRVETTLVDSFFKDIKEFRDYVNYQFKNFEVLGVKNGLWEKIPDADLVTMMTEYISPGKLGELSTDQMDELIVYLVENTNANLMRIASLLHVNYDYVRKLVRRIF